MARSGTMNTRTGTLPQDLESRWLTTTELMAYLKLGSKTTLQKLREQGLPVHDLGGSHRYDRLEVDDWIRSRCSDLTPGEGHAA
jgi:excisionase family DNA binding protein